MTFVMTVNSVSQLTRNVMRKSTVTVMMMNSIVAEDWRTEIFITSGQLHVILLL